METYSKPIMRRIKNKIAVRLLANSVSIVNTPGLDPSDQLKIDNTAAFDVWNDAQ